MELSACTTESDDVTKSPGRGFLGIYIHVPFCVRKCRYCDFYSCAYDERAFLRTVDALERELTLRARSLGEGGVRVATVFLGGGTPSLLRPQHIERLLAATEALFPVSRPVEVTIEVNPQTVDKEWFSSARRAGIDRVSIGVQSLRDADLEVLGRCHTAAEARDAVTMAREAGFDNVGLDLIYGVPGQELSSWESTLVEAVSLGPDHVSAYELTITPGTPMADALARGEIQTHADETIAEMFHVAGEVLGAAGLSRYEISNYARSGMECLHNLHYWRGGEYLGVGPSSHSHVAGRRWWNVRDLGEYLRRVEAGTDPVEGAEDLNAEDMRREHLLLSLRRREGVSIAVLSPTAKAAVPGFVASGLAHIASGRFVLTEEGLLLADEIAVQIA